MARTLCAVALLGVASATAPPKFEANANNVAGSMPSPSGSAKNGVLLLGSMSSAAACEAAATADAKASSWTYHHCEFPPAGSGNYSCQ